MTIKGEGIHSNDSLRRQTLAGVGWTALAQIGRQAFQFVISVILARLLTPHDFGLVGMIIVFTGFASLFSEMGFSSALIQREKLDERHYSSVFWVNLFVSFCLTVLLIAASPAIAGFYKEPILASLTVLISLNLVIGSLSMVQYAILSRNMNFRGIAIIDIITMIIAGIAAVILALRGYGVWSLVWQMLMVSFAKVLLIWRMTGWHPRWIFDKAAVKELIGFSSNLLGFNMINYWSRNADNLLIGKFIGIAELGIYNRAYSFMLLPVNQISRVLSKVMMPALSRLQDNRPKVKDVYLRTIAMIAFITFPLMFGLMVVAKHFILFLYGPKWAMLENVLKIFCMVGMIQSLVGTAGWIYLSQGRTDWLFRWNILAGMVTLISFVIGVSIGTVEAVAWCYTIANGLLLYWNFSIPGRLINMTFTDVIRKVSGVFGCAAAMAAAVSVLGILLPSGWAHWAYLSVQVPFGCIVYIALMHFARLEAYKDVMGMIREQLRLSFKRYA